VPEKFVKTVTDINTLGGTVIGTGAVDITAS
jgi:hypothetical protein